MIWNSDRNFLTLVIYSILPSVGGTVPEKNCTSISVLELALSTFLSRLDDLFIYIKSLLNTILWFNDIYLITCQADFIFWDIIPYFLAFCINEIK